MFFTEVGDGYEDGLSLEKSLSNLGKASSSNLDPGELLEKLTSIDSQAIKLQRSIRGVVDTTGYFNDQLVTAYKNTQKLGGTFKDTVGAVEGLSKGMGKLVAPTADVLQGIIGIAKGIGATPEVIGEMTSNLTRFGGKQKEIIGSIEDMAKTARRSGLDAKAFLSEVNTNLGKVSGFGFKSGVLGLQNMVKQAKLLRTTMDGLGAMRMQDDLLTPEGAIAAAAGFQMLGGEIGKLGDPFQLMHMAQTDLQGLQDELAKSAASAASFNEKTGNFDIATADLYRLKEQAKLTGADFNQLVDAGKEAAKLDFLKDKFNLENSGLDEDGRNMLAGLANIGKGGNVEIDIPGLKIDADSEDDLKSKLTPDAIQKLKDYQAIADKSSEELAASQLSVTEKQAISVNQIRDAILLGLDKSKRESITKSYGEAISSGATGIATANKDLSPKVITAAEGTLGVMDKFVRTIEKESGTGRYPDPSIKEKYGKYDNTGKGLGLDNQGKIDTEFMEDLFLSEGSAPQIFSKGTLYKGIVGDEVAIGTGLSEAFNKTGKLTELMASIPSRNNGSGENTSVNGKIDININLGGSVSGDNGNVEKMFSDPKFQKQMMDMVLYKMDKYKQQQGTLS